MKIRKVSQPTPLSPGNGAIVDSYSTSSTDGYSCDYINGIGQYYSTTEKEIGTWIDGKPIYRKVIFVNDPSNRTTTLNPGIDMDNMVQVYGFAKRPNSYLNPIPCTYSSWEIYAYDFSGSHINVVFSTNQWNAGVDYFYLVLEYTKSTD